MLSEEDLRAGQEQILVLRAEVEDLRSAWDRHENALGAVMVAGSLEAARYLAASTMIEERRIRVLAFRKRMLMGANPAIGGTTFSAESGTSGPKRRR